ncbi:C40 family peptidase [Streptomyces lichenis]|uniref:NlpC/P60 family protein n=1 Tax=Streptomyces lichenis TaxID=2306967 RepID=A0ABT0IBS1_9ACTN|nr:C40 family peptidase [Streptomyces lichenis]MCK8678771.1 NlpC/P60 family protein [Streptomyces lichenis]
MHRTNRTMAAAGGLLLATALSCTGTATAAAPPLPATAATVAAADCRPQADTSEQARAIVDAACSQLGVPYSWGGGSLHGPTYGQDYPGGGPGAHDSKVKGFDCSHLVQYAAWQGAGIALPEGSWNQAQWSGATARFSRDQGLGPLQPGDLLLWGSNPANLNSVHHIAVYLGGGRMVEARESGTLVMVSDVRLNAQYAGALRIAGTEQPPAGTKRFITWGTGVGLRPEPGTGKPPVVRLPGPTAVDVQCQQRGEVVNAEGYRNDAWSYLPKYRAWISNIYIDDPAAWLPGVPTC